MGYLGRLSVTFGVTVLNLVFLIIWYRVAQPLMDMGAQGAAHYGPFSAVYDPMNVLVPASIGILQLGTLLWLIYGSAQSERTQRTQFRRARR